MLEQLQPIDGHYFTTAYFWITSAIAVIVAFVGVFFMGGDK